MVKKYLYRILDFLFPIQCSFCGTFDFFSSKISICKKCIHGKMHKPVLKEKVCRICSSEITEEECDYCNSRNIFFSKLFFIRLKGDFEREIIQKMKFGNLPLLGNFFRIGLRRLLAKLKEENYTNIVIVPSNRQTNRNRPIPVCDSVIRYLENNLGIMRINPIIKNSKELQSGKNYRERFIHAQNAFSVRQDYKEFSGKYLIVDDVFTTGATINEIAKTLLLKGASKVDILVLVKGKV